MELWKDIPGYEGLYQVSSLGKVKRLFNEYHNAEEHILRPSKMGGNSGKGDYQFISLSKNNIVKNNYIHRLVGLAFIPNPDNLPQIDHINQNKLDNRVENLRWVSRSQNHLNKVHKVANSGERYIRKDSRSESYCFSIVRRVDGKSTPLISRSFPTLQEAVEFRNNYTAEIKYKL